MTPIQIPEEVFIKWMSPLLKGPYITDSSPNFIIKIAARHLLNLSLICKNYHSSLEKELSSLKESYVKNLDERKKVEAAYRYLHPVHGAIATENSKELEILFKGEADIRSLNRKGMTPFEYGTYLKKPKMLELLKKYLTLIDSQQS